MFLERGNVVSYGIPYQGSKTKLIEHIAKFFPNADHFYDLFGGGFSVTHYMLENRRKSYKHFHYNEIRKGLCDLVRDAIDGKYSFEVFKPEWISRERFMRDKESNAYIKIIWSFGNNGIDYLFGKDIENEKRSMHQAVVFDEFDSFMEKTFCLTKWPNDLSITGNRLYLKKLCNRRIDLQQLKQLQQLEQLERLQQLQQLQQLERLERLHFTNSDYRDVLIHPNSVIYCDIPYKNTASYGNEFSQAEFFDWANSQSNPVFVSEYGCDDSRFTLLKEFAHRTTFSSSKENKISKTVERLYGNRVATEIIQNAIKNKR